MIYSIIIFNALTCWFSKAMSIADVFGTEFMHVSDSQSNS